MTTSEESIEEEANGGDDSKNYDFISLSRHKCGKKGHIQKDCRSKGNGSSGN